MERTALVLSGGGLRGGAHIGALKVFERVGLLQSVQVVAGTSAGAIAGAMLASGARVAAIEKAILKLSTASCDQLLDPNTAGLRTALCAQDFGQFHGFLGGKAIVDLVEENLVYLKRFTDYATLSPDAQAKVKDLLLVAVNLDTGARTVFCDPNRYTGYDEAVLCGQLGFADAARASSSEPVVVTPFVCSLSAGCTCPPRTGEALRRQSFIDGAVRDNCPVKIPVRLAGCTRMLAINLGYAGDRVEDVASEGMADIVSQSLSIMGSQQLDADLAHLRTQVADGDLRLSAFVLNPRLFDMGMFAFDRLDEAIRRGEMAAEWFLNEVDRQLHVFRPDGCVDVDRFFGQQGVFSYNYPDPERDARRQRLLVQLNTPALQKPGPCHVERQIIQMALLAIGAVAALSLAFFTLGGLVALNLKPNAATAADIFVFWDGGLVLLLLGWIIFLIIMRRRLCRSQPDN